MSMLFSQHLNWNLLAFFPELSHFDLEHNSKKNNKSKIVKAFKVLKQSINPTKDDFLVNFLSSYIFQFPAYIFSLDCRE